MDLSRIARNSAALALLDIVMKLTPLLTFPFVVRVLGPEIYGKLAFVTATAGLFALLANVGLPIYGAREVARRPAEAGAIVAEVTGVRVLFSLAAYALLAAFALSPLAGDAVVRSLLLLTGLSFLVGSLDLQWLFVGMSRMWPILLAGLAGQAVYVAMILGLIRKPEHAYVVPLAAAASALVAAVFVAAAARGTIRWAPPRLPRQHWGSLMAVCTALALAAMMSMIYDQIDVVMLRYLRSESEVGLYAAAYRIMSVSLSFMPIVGRVFFPVLSSAAQGDAAGEKRYLTWMAAGMLGIALPITVGGFLLAAPISHFLLGAQYVGSERLLRWLMLNVIAGASASYFACRLVPHGREKAYLGVVSLGAAMNVVLNLVFIPRYGAMAAVVSTIVSQLAVAAAGRWASRDLPWPRLVRPLAAPALATVAMAAALAGLGGFRLHVTALIAIGGVVFVLAHQLCRTLLFPAAPPVAVPISEPAAPIQ